MPYQPFLEGRSSWGEKHQTVPILVTNNTKSMLNIIEKYLIKIGVAEKNVYLSQHNTTMTVVACASIVYYVEHPTALRTTRLKKHITTMTQLLNLENELEIMARYMGHDIRVHREYYRLPEETQVAKLALKLHIAMDEGMQGLKLGQDVTMCYLYIVRCIAFRSYRFLIGFTSS